MAQHTVAHPSRRGTSRRRLLLASAGVGAVTALGLSAASSARPEQPAGYHKPHRGWTLIKGGSVLTMQSPLSVARHDILIHNGVIQQIGPNLRVPGAPGKVRVVDARGLILTPGLVDNHHHPEMCAEGYAASMDFWGPDRKGGYFEHVLNGVMSKITPEDAYWSVLASALFAIDHGVTSIGLWDNTPRTVQIAEAGVNGLNDSGIRAVYLYGPPSSVTPPFIPPGQPAPAMPHPVTTADMQRVAGRIKWLADRGALLSFGIGENTQDSRGQITEAWFQEGLTRAVEVFPGVPVLVHAGLIGRVPGAPSSLQWMEANGWLQKLGRRLTLVHFNFASDADLLLAASREAGVSISAFIEPSMFRDPQLHRFMQAGITRLSCSTDNPTAVEPDLRAQMFHLLQITREQMKAAGVPSTGGLLPINADTVLPMGTRGGAESLGLPVGVLEPGRPADIVGWRRPRLSNTPPTPGALLGYRHEAELVLIDGRLRKLGGEMTIGDAVVRRVEARNAATRQRLVPAGE